MDDYGEDSDFVRTRVLGEFPRTGSTQFIGPELVQQAMDRELAASGARDPLVIGVDVARFGDDESVIYPRRGMDARSLLPLSFRNIPLDKLEDQVVAFCNSHRVMQIFVDGTGVGGGLVDHLRRRGYLVADVQFGARADQMIDGTRFANKRAEIWGLLRNALQHSSWSCLNSAVLRGAIDRFRRILVLANERRGSYWSPRRRCETKASLSGYGGRLLHPSAPKSRPCRCWRTGCSRTAQLASMTLSARPPSRAATTMPS